jgi:16S rRNA (cytidine1402-2'-O)-methyltransferase
MPGRLFLVATPIGNLGDLSPRAVETLRAVQLVACEDTRHSRILLDQHGVSTPTQSLPAFSEGARAEGLIARLLAGADVALVTDAGSPGVSDPGERLVAEAVEAGVEVLAIPGPTALVAALTVSGLPTGRFHFLGFLPRQASEARAMLEEVEALAATLVLYESPRRTADTLGLLAEVLGDRRACVARELTKLHEEVLRDRLGALAATLGGREVRGEVVIVVEGRTGAPRWSEEEVQAAVQAGLARGERLKPLSTELARLSGWTSQAVYRLGLRR